MWPRSEHEIFEASAPTNCFDGDSVRGILERAAAEQYRRDRARADAYSHEELEEMAAEAGISREALRAAIPVFHPPSAGVEALSRRVKTSFDPKGILNPGRMTQGL